MALSVERAAAPCLRHVVAQARGRRALYPDAAARTGIARRLADCCIRHRLRCIVWCVTDRCLHVVLQGAAAPLTLATHELLGHRLRHGHWTSTTVRCDVYLLELVRHALLAPVRGGLCRQAADWSCSSARETLGLRPAPPWLDLACLQSLAGGGAGAATHWQRLLAARRPPAFGTPGPRR